ncbi:beta-ketoacyl-ACP synthase [Simiduia curdlanivorans]|uniref:Beta-ketoacyl-ACP synthase n=1 Tax=Simiduia curdlanivorans TaxID=1492769 RepID=A0ABV8V508_9GAMM|nr:beta-ketoacyl-ACP synthase [Simiduia curdlanivorans]MDN3640794.1 beta-ketoacyl-ACP synthase [Simiduia curdlanivorans]
MTAPVYIHGFGLTSATGIGLAAHRQVLWESKESPLTKTDQFSPGRELALGLVTAELPNVDFAEPSQRSRNNQLLWSAWLQLLPIWSRLDIDPARVAIVLGTSTSGIRESEASFQPESELPLDYPRQQIAAPAAFLADQLGVTGPAYTLSTACTSGAKALATGRRLLQSGLVDWVIAGGADALCGLTVNGFAALDAVSTDICQPMSVNRCGINIGEGAALFLLSNQPAKLAITGAGESSDAHHISAPEPTGAGAEVAIRAALDDAALAPSAIGYVNLHGTATALNDKMEAAVILRLLDKVPCSSTKPYMGHTLGAAGALEAGLCALALTDAKLPLHLWDGCVDADLAPLNLVSSTSQNDSHARHALSTSFAFGGNNIALIVSKID